jgi:hypothetical protein
MILCDEFQSESRRWTRRKLIFVANWLNILLPLVESCSKYYSKCRRSGKSNRQRSGWRISKGLARKCRWFHRPHFRPEPGCTSTCGYFSRWLPSCSRCPFVFPRKIRNSARPQSNTELARWLAISWRRTLTRWCICGKWNPWQSSEGSPKKWIVCYRFPMINKCMINSSEVKIFWKTSITI